MSDIAQIMSQLDTTTPNAAYSFLRQCTWPNTPRLSSGEVDKNAPCMQFSHLVGNAIQVAQDSKYADQPSLDTLTRCANDLRRPIGDAESLLPSLNKDKTSQINTSVGALRNFQEQLREVVASLLVHRYKNEYGLG